MNDPQLLIDLAEKHTSLRQVSGKLLGLCPLHDEKTPSFWIYPDKGKFHCYGCQARGDAIDLYQALTGASYIDGKKWAGLWDNTRPQPKPRPPQPPREYTSDDRRECYRIARATIIRMRDCEITYQGKKYHNHDFIFEQLATVPDPILHLNKILQDIWDRHKNAADIYTRLFFNEIATKFDIEEVDNK